MKLRTVRIRDYRSIRDTGEFLVEDVACLVGKNESGKTSVLQALYKLNPLIPEHGKFDVTDEYPRSDVEEYRQQIESGQRKHAVVVEAGYDLDPEEVSSVESEFGKGVFSKTRITLSKTYENKLLVSVPVNESVAVKHLVAAAKLPKQLAAQAAKSGTLKELADFLDTDGKKREADAAAARTEAQAIGDADEKGKALRRADELGETAGAKALKTTIAGAWNLHRTFGLHVWDKYLKVNWPKFLYFDEYYQMEGHVNIEKLKERQSKQQLKTSDRPMLGLIDLARLNLDELLNPTRTEVLVSKLEGASNHLSKQILRYWSQNQHLHVRFDVRPARPEDPEDMRNGNNLWGRVYDSVHEVRAFGKNEF